MNALWILVRASGFAAYGLLAAATVWGLLLSIGLLGRSVSPKNVTRLHESLSMAAIIATVAHMGFLWTDSYVEFGPAELLVPGASAWRPLPVALGVTAFYGLLITTLSFYVRRFIGQRAWRTVHYLTFGVFLGSALHGATAGADSGHPIAQGVYVSTVALVLGLVAVRVVTLKAPARKASASAAQRVVAEAGTPRRSQAAPEQESPPTPVLESA